MVMVTWSLQQYLLFRTSLLNPTLYTIQWFMSSWSERYALQLTDCFHPEDRVGNDSVILLQRWFRVDSIKKTKSRILSECKGIRKKCRIFPKKIITILRTTHRDSHLLGRILVKLIFNSSENSLCLVITATKLIIHLKFLLQRASYKQVTNKLLASLRNSTK